MHLDERTNDLLGPIFTLPGLLIFLFHPLPPHRRVPADAAHGAPVQAARPGRGPVHTPGMPNVVTSENPIALQIETSRLL
jgi:hypothetical protein